MNDIEIARRYISKMDNAYSRNIEFSLPLQSFVNIMRAKRCYYTGERLNEKTLTIDRIDASKGYIKGNCCACHKTVNKLKGMIENDNILTFDNVIKALNKAISPE